MLDAMTQTLSSSQIRQLKSAAQKLEPVLKAGKNGLSPAFLESVHQALASRELIKIKFAELKDQKKELAPVLAEKTGSHLVTLVGNVAVLYRRNPDPAKRSIEI